MKKIFIILLAGLFIYGCSSSKETTSLLPGKYDDYTLLSNGWRLTPAGENVPIGELPLNLILTKDGRYAITSNSGAGSASISVIDLSSRQEIQRIHMPDTWRGLTLSKNEEKLYVSGGFSDKVFVYDFNKGNLSLTDSIIFVEAKPQALGLSGIAICNDKNLFLAVSKKSNSLYIYGLGSKKLLKSFNLNTECFDVVVDHKEKYAYISLWGSSSVARLDLQNLLIDKTIKVGDHPCEILISKDDQYLFAANANNNSTSVVELGNFREIEKLVSSLQPNAPAGSTPNSISLTEDETRLYIANADNNYLAIFDITEPGDSKSLGFIPVGWYPTSVRVSALNKIIVANGKGLTSAANPNGPMHGQETEDSTTQYIGNLFNGTLSVIDVPGKDQLEKYTAQVYSNTPYTRVRQIKNEQNIIPLTFNGRRSDKIKHVFYVIKENRTYDQVFGDLSEGNGDSSLCIFNEEITPNQHKLAREFSLFDNFYVDAEVSADGHNWSTAAYATDYVEKTWPAYYGDRGGSYDYEGGKKIASPSSGYIWDQVIEKGLSFRNYGEYADEEVVDGVKRYIGLEKNNKAFTCESYPGWDLKIPDRKRFKFWKADFEKFIAADSLPDFQIIRLPNDHTAGTSKGFPTIRAMVADNDYAVGLLIETLSKTKFWNESIVFILEDDAQNGSDHVDAHRSPLLVISPFIKRHFVDHTMYSTSSVLKTIELILGLEPMTQYDLSALPVVNALTDKTDFTTFSPIIPKVNLNEMNTASLYGTERSSQMNLSREDAIPDIEFNEIIWKYMKGEDSPMPVPVRSAYLKPAD